MLLNFKEHPFWDSITFRLAESEPKLNVETLLFEKRASVIVADVGGRSTLTTKSMNNQQFSLANRKQLADILSDKYDGLRYKAKQRFRQKVDTLRAALINEYAEKKGATKIAGQIEVEQAKLKDLNASLSELGFELYHGNLSLHSRSSNPLDDIINKRIEKDLGDTDAIDARFDSAQVAMMTVATLEDAQKLLKSVTEI
jgi:hypothetical protein